METLTRDEALAVLAALPGYSEIVARNVLFEATKIPYLTVSNDAVFIAATRHGTFVIADVPQAHPYNWPDGSKFAALLKQAKQAGARFPGWADA